MGTKAPPYEGETVRKLASQMVGDGKQPNQYFVTADSTFYALDDSDPKFKSWTDPSEVDPIFKKWIIPHSQTWGPYPSYIDALVKFWEIYEDLPAVPEVCNAFHSVVIEDRLSGQITEGGLHAARFKNQWAAGWKFHTCFYETLDYTKKIMGFDIKKYRDKKEWDEA